MGAGGCRVRGGTQRGAETQKVLGDAAWMGYRSSAVIQRGAGRVLDGGLQDGKGCGGTQGL